MYIQKTSHAVLLLLLCSLAAAAARPLQRIAAVPLPEPSVQPGNLTGRVLTRKVFKAQGGAFAMLGRPALLQLKRASRFVGSVEALATHLETEKDLVSAYYNQQCLGSAAPLAVRRCNQQPHRHVGHLAAPAPGLTRPAAVRLPAFAA